MKICCADYNTKPRTVWQPFIDRSSRYTDDPVAYIDPSSFLSYATCLNARHMRIKQTIPGIFRAFPAYDALLRTVGLSMARRIFSLTAYSGKGNVMLLGYKWQYSRQIVSFARIVRRLYPNMILIGLPADPFGELRERWQDEQHRLSDLIAFFNICSVIISPVRATVPYQQSMTNTPVVYLPRPYPVSHARRFWKPSQEKDPILFIAGESARHDVIASHLAARAIQQRHPEFTLYVTRHLKTPINRSILKTTNYRTVPVMPWHSFLPYVARTKIMLNSEQWWTRGRVQADCAAVGTPSVAGPSDAQQELFPDLVIHDIQDFNKMMELSLQLIGDNSLYERTVHKAKLRLESYDFPHARKRFQMLIRLVGENRASAFPELVWKHNVLEER